MDKRDKRTYKSEIRAAGDDKELIIEGYASVFNSDSEEMWGFIERVEEGFFDSVLDNDVRALFNHDPNLILGRTTSKTLSLSVDKTGLRYSVVLPDTQYSRDLYKLVERGDITQSSFAFSVDVDKWEYDEKRNITVRRLVKASKLYDVSPVTYPAYSEATVEVKRALEQFQRSRETKSIKNKYHFLTEIQKLK